MGSSPDPVCSISGRVKPMTLKLILVAPSMALGIDGERDYEDRERTGWLSVRIM